MRTALAPSAAPLTLRVASLCVIILACSIPISVALDNILLLLLLVLVLLGDGRKVIRIAVGNPVARASVVLFGALCLGSAYGIATLNEAAGTLGKYVDLLFVPLFMVAGREVWARRAVVPAFLAVMSITAVMSWLVGMGKLSVAEWMVARTSIDNPAIFRSSITQNILMAYASYLFLLCARASEAQWKRWLHIALALLTASSILFLVQGKTGYLVMFGLLTYFAWGAWSRHLYSRGHAMGGREAVGAGLAALLLMYGTYQFVPRLHERVNQAVAEFEEWRPSAHFPTSTGERLEFYHNTLTMIKQHPMLGVGTGGFPAAYALQIQESGVGQPTHNPHNEYLLITIQIGMGGLALLLYLFFTQWRHAAKLPNAFEQDAARGLVLTIAITALFNSPLLDHTEGLFFAFASALLFANLNTSKRDG